MNNGNAAGETSAAGETTSTPPFSTKEPERYQATRITTFSLGNGASPNGASPILKTSRKVITRDGEQRREDFELTTGVEVSDLQLAAGNYRLVHASKLYAELKPDNESGKAEVPQITSPDFSPNKLINQSTGGTRYEKLGAEEINGRATTKYRVTLTGTTGEAKSVTTVTLIWIDDSLGMPIKSETTSVGGTADGSKYMTELRDLKQEVDLSRFELPPDYRKVELKELQRQLSLK